MNCGQCKFMSKTGHTLNLESGFYECRRYPPKGMDCELKMRFPLVTLTTWCGEFKKKIKPKEG